MATKARTMQDSAADYEQHLRERWETLSPYEQEEGRAYLAAKFAGPKVIANRSGAKWTVGSGYASAVFTVLLPWIFGIFTFGFGLYNAATGRVGHGVIQILLSFFCVALGLSLMS